MPTGDDTLYGTDPTCSVNVTHHVITTGIGSCGDNAVVTCGREPMSEYIQSKAAPLLFTSPNETSRLQSAIRHTAAALAGPTKATM